MSDAAIEARRLTLIRFEHAAGAAFGCDDDAAGVPPARALVNATTITLATFATAVAATTRAIPPPARARLLGVAAREVMLVSSRAAP